MDCKLCSYYNNSYERQNKLIIVDDNEAFLSRIEFYLKKYDTFDIVARFNSGVELLEYSNLCTVDLILLDIEMPELNGIETAKRVNFKCPHLKLIAITMYQDKVYLQQLIESGFHGFVNKTVMPQGLYDTIDDVLKDKFSFPESIQL